MASRMNEQQLHLPPGTFHLFRQLENEEGTVLELDPTPTDDPNDPLNWTKARKTLNFVLVNAVTVIVFTALSIQLLFWQDMIPDMGVTYSQLNNATSVNNAGLSMGCVLFIPFARKYGRRPVYLVSTAVLAAMAFWTAKMQTVAELYVTNLLTGLAGAVNETIVQMTIADLFFVHHRGTMNGFYITAVMCGSFLTSIPAGVQGTNEGWRWSYWTMGIFNAVVFFLFLFLYEETKFAKAVFGVAQPNTEQPHSGEQTKASDSSNTTIHAETLAPDHVDLKRLATREYRAEPHINTNIPLESYKQRLRWITKTDESLLRMFYEPFGVLFSFPHIMYTALQYASGVAWLTIMSAIMSITFAAPPYNFTPAGIGYLSVGPFFGNLLGSLYGGLLGDWTIKWLARRNNGYFEPEFRLYLLHLPTIFIAGGLIMFGATADRGMHWIWPTVGGAFFGFGLGAVADSALTLVIDAYREITGNAFVGIAFVRNVFGIAIPFAITPWLEISSLTNIFITCAGISLGISGLFVPLIFYGKRIRVKTAPKYIALLEKNKGNRT